MGSRKVLDTYILAIVFGLLGFHHFFLKRYFFGILYACTFGLFGIGYVVDLFRIKELVHHKNHKSDKTGKQILESDVYLLCAVLGIFGMHHFYLRNHRVAFIYLFTFGAFGFGWIGDLFRVQTLITNAGSNVISVGTARILALSPVGLFGAHHYYLRNYSLALLYTFTFGVFGTGWLVDIFRIEDRVKAAPEQLNKYERSELTARILCASPLGLLGVHHFYLKRPRFGVLYILTLGWFGIGWLYDMFRLPVLYKRCTSYRKPLYTDDAYMLWFPFGILGLHQIYLKRTKWALLYACTFGAVGVGWMIDAFRLKQLVNEHNKTRNHNDLITMNFDNYSVREAFCFCFFYDTEDAEDGRLTPRDTNSSESDKMMPSLTDVNVHATRVLSTQSSYGKVHATRALAKQSSYGNVHATRALATQSSCGNVHATRALAKQSSYGNVHATRALATQSSCGNVQATRALATQSSCGNVQATRALATQSSYDNTSEEVFDKDDVFAKYTSL